MQEEMRSLLKSPGWARLAEILNEQAVYRQNSILTTEEESIKDVLSIARMKGERQGILLAVNLPETILANLKEEIANAVETDEA